MTRFDLAAVTPQARLGIVAVMGLALGCAAFIPDLMTEQAAPYATPLVSSGFAWGCIALITGFQFRRPETAALAGIGVLMLATITYYALIVLVSRRWDVDAELSTGAPYSGLWSVARSTGLWLAGSACGGAIMGILGYLIRKARPGLASAATGLAAGFLGGEAFFTLIRVRSVWIGPLTQFDLSKLVPSIAQLALTAMAITLLIRKRSERTQTPALLLALLASLAVNILVWYLVETARHAFY